MNIGYLSTIYHTSLLIKNQYPSIISEKLNWKLYPTGPAMIKGFKEGEIDLGYIGLPPVMIGLENRLDLQCIAGGHVEGTVMVAPDHFKEINELPDIKTVLNQFQGKTIGIPTKGSIHDVITRELLQDNSLEKEITIKNYSWPDMIPYALEDDEIDAIVGTPSIAVTASQVTGTKIIIPPSNLWSYNPSYGIVAETKVIEEKSEFLKEFLVIHETMCNMLRKNTEKAVEITTNELGLKDSAFASKTFNISPRYCASLPGEYIDSTMKFIPVLKKLGYLKSDLKKEDIFCTDLIEEVHPEDPHY